LPDPASSLPGKENDEESAMTGEYRAVAYTNGYEFNQGAGYTLPQYPFVAPPELTTRSPSARPCVTSIWPD